MSLQSTDPEYTQRLGAFLEEVKNEPGSMLEPTTRWLAILATLTGSGRESTLANSVVLNQWLASPSPS